MIRLQSNQIAAPGRWAAASSSKKKEMKTRQALSGIACPENSSGQRLCLAVFDEGGEARYLVIGDGEV